MPLQTLAPADATHAAPIVASDAECVGFVAPFVIMSTMLSATVRPMIPDGMPVRGGAGAITVPFFDLRGREMAWGGANAMPAANTFAYFGDW